MGLRDNITADMDLNMATKKLTFKQIKVIYKSVLKYKEDVILARSKVWITSGKNKLPIIYFCVDEDGFIRGWKRNRWRLD